MSAPKPFPAAQVSALKTIRDLWPDIEIRLIGAAALACQTGLWWRTTGDLDLCVSLSLDAFPGPLALVPGWSRHPRHEHEWHGPGEVKLDVIPAGPEAMHRRRLDWPESGFSMSLVGFRHVFTMSLPVEIAPGFVIDVAAVPVIALLKMVSYLDRPHERRRDVKDLAWLLAEYLEADDARRWSDEVVSAGVEFEAVSAFVMGRDLRDALDDEEAAVVRDFVTLGLSDLEPTATQLHLLQDGPARWRERPEELVVVLDAFRRGALGA